MNIMVLAPLPHSRCSFILKTIKNLEKNHLQTDKISIWAYITSAYSMSKAEEAELLETLAWMGIK